MCFFRLKKQKIDLFFEGKMNILMACESSGIVSNAFADLGHNVLSCDLLPAESYKNHYQGDVLNLLQAGWDMMIAFPPCTYLSYVAARWDRMPGRAKKRVLAFEFFMKLINAPIKKICIENPRGYPMVAYRAADQIVQPYYFGDSEMKTTHLWLKGLPCLAHFEQDTLFGQAKTHTVMPKPSSFTPRGKPRWFVDTCVGVDRQKQRSQFWPGIAKAMAMQWGVI